MALRPTQQAASAIRRVASVTSTTRKNAPGGALTLEGIPARYEPSARYRITVGLSRPDVHRGGFQLTARFAEGTQKGRQAGSWQLLDDRAQLVPGDNEPAQLFVEHTSHGSLAAVPGSLTWVVEWTAPGGGDPVEFSAAGNAANDDASPLGDYVYLAGARSQP